MSADNIDDQRDAPTQAAWLEEDAPPRPPKVPTDGKQSFIRTRGMSTKSLNRIIQVPAADAMEWVQKEVKTGRSCRSLPFTIVFWLTFTLVSVSHKQVELVSSLQATMLDVFKTVPNLNVLPEDVKDAVTNDSAASGRKLVSGVSTSKISTPMRATGFEDVITIEDVYGWTNGVAMPILWGGGSLSMKGLVRHFNRVVGGMRVIQVRAKEEECPGMDGLREVYGSRCYPQGGDVSQERLGEGHGFSPDEKDRYLYWFDIEHPLEKVSQELENLRQRSWLSSATLKAQVESLLYNGEVGQFVLLQAFFTVDRGGSIKSKLKICSLPTEVYPSWAAYFGDFLWLMLLMYLFIGEIHTVWTHFQKRKLGGLFNMWFFINWASIIGGIGIGGFFGWIAKRLDEVAEVITQIPGPPDDANSTQWQVRTDFFHIQFDDVVEICERQGWHELFMFWFTLLITCKFFQAFQANPRLAVITTTLKEASIDMLHFLLIFGIVFLNYALGGHLLFGKQLKEWKSLGASVNACFLVLMGDFSYNDMYQVAPIVSQLWFWSYMLLVFLVMLNMLLAIIMDAYASVKEKSQSSESLYEQFWALKEEVATAKQTQENWNRALRHTLAKKDPKALELIFLALEERQRENGDQAVSVEILEEIGVEKEHAVELLQEIRRWKTHDLDEEAEGKQEEDDIEEEDEAEMARLEEEYQQTQEQESLVNLGTRMDKLEDGVKRMQEENERANAELLKNLDVLINGGKNVSPKLPPRAPAPPPWSPKPPSLIRHSRHPPHPQSLPGVPDADSHGQHPHHQSRGPSGTSNRATFTNANHDGIGGPLGTVVDI